MESGCRRGELFNLQWLDVDLKRREFRIRAEYAKDGETRVLPISSRLAGVSKWRGSIRPGNRIQPAERTCSATAGPHVKNTKRAWTNACKRAGIADLSLPRLAARGGLSCSRPDWPIHHVKEMLGHANVSQTARILNAGKMGLHDSMQRFDGTRCNPVANEENEEPPLDRNDETQETPKSLVN